MQYDANKQHMTCSFYIKYFCFKIQIQTLSLTQTHQQYMVIAQLHKMY